MRWRFDIALGTVLFVEVLRIFLPSLITLFGQAAATPAELMGLYALVWFVLPLVVIGVARVVKPALTALGCGLLLVLGRMILQWSNGGDLQLYVSSVAVTFGIAWLISTAMSSTNTVAAVQGFAIGIGASVTLHGALSTVDLAWRDNWQSHTVAIALALGTAWALRKRYLVADKPTVITGTTAWFGLGPAFLLTGMFAANPAYAQSITEWPSWLILGLVAAVVVAASAVVSDPRRYTISPFIAAGLVVVSAVGFVVIGPAEVLALHGLALLVLIVGIVGVFACLGWAAHSTTERSLSASGWMLGGGMLVFIVLMFGYYAAYDIAYSNEWAPVAGAVVLGSLAVVSGAVPGRAKFPRRLVWLPIVAAATVVLPLMWQPVPDYGQSSSQGLRVVSYNIRMGFGLDGTFDVSEQARAVAALQPEVVLLSEVDRGWMLNGGHDVLRVFAERIGMNYVWAPAADSLWGDAILTNLPVLSAVSHPLVDGGPTGAQALEAVVNWRGDKVTVISTHLQPPAGWSDLAQVTQLAVIAEDAAERGPVIVGGDLNLEPGEPAWNELMKSGLHDAFVNDRPFDTMAVPSEPVQQIDHILYSGEWAAKNAANPLVPYSDHRPVAVTLHLLG